MSDPIRSTKSSTRKRNQRSMNDVEIHRIIDEVETAVLAGRGEVTFPRKGRPSLTGRHEVSPSVGFRITPELRARAEAVAGRRGLSVSALARQALEEYLRKAS